MLFCVIYVLWHCKNTKSTMKIPIFRRYAEGSKKKLSQPMAGLPTQPPVRDSDSRTPLLSSLIYFLLLLIFSICCLFVASSSRVPWRPWDAPQQGSVHRLSCQSRPQALPRRERLLGTLAALHHPWGWSLLLCTAPSRKMLRSNFCTFATSNDIYTTQNSTRHVI